MGLDAKGNPMEINSRNACNYCWQSSVVHQKTQGLKSLCQAQTPDNLMLVWGEHCKDEEPGKVFPSNPISGFTSLPQKLQQEE